jgi:hypothetical protein
MDNTKVCIICNNEKPLTRFCGAASIGYGNACIDCYKDKFQDGLVIFIECDGIKPLNMYRQFTDTQYGKLCHDCYSKDWIDNTMLYNKCNTYKSLDSYKEFNNGFHKPTCTDCIKGNWKKRSKEYYAQHKDEIISKQKEKKAKKREDQAKLNPKPDPVTVDTLTSIDLKSLVHDQLTCKLLKEIAKLTYVKFLSGMTKAEMINCLVKFNILSNLALPQAKPRPPGMKLSTEPTLC